jgi:hypothetical protein
MQAFPRVAPLFMILLLTAVGCSTVKKGDTTQDQSETAKPEKKHHAADEEAMLAIARSQGGPVDIKAPKSSIDLTFLLSMDYKEAKAISAQSIETANGARIAADSIEVVKMDRDGKPKKIRAKGKVYIETGAADGAKILCQEAYVNGNEAILRGKPILQRGGSIVEGLDEGTVFYLLGTRLRVIGLHKLTNEGSMLANMPDLGPWTGGPNPLLPPLNEGAVPTNIRAEMLKAAEAEAVLQNNKAQSQSQPEAAPAPWIKTAKSETPKTPGKKGAPDEATLADTQQETASKKRRATTLSLRR